MLSILIPVYNYDVRPLVADLSAQCRAAAIAFEILCFDDGSRAGFRAMNRELRTLPQVRYEEMPENLGRSGIRNRLSAAARYDYLLFMDCDSGVVRDDYIAVYRSHLRPDRLLYGGRVYRSEKPADPALLLHWRFGRAREQAPASKRQQKPHHGFMTNNFVAPRHIARAIPFDERLVQYGHEDTLFGLELQNRGIPVQHLDNPLEHLGLETADVFLEKTERAIANLQWLKRENLSIETRLLRTEGRLRKYRLGSLARTLLGALRPVILKNLRSAHPDLRCLDLYKLWLMLKEER